METIEHRWDCCECTRIGEDSGMDLYFCTNEGDPVVVVRNEKAFILAGLGAPLDDALQAAQTIALERGLVTQQEVTEADLDWSEIVQKLDTLDGFEIAKFLSTAKIQEAYLERLARWPGEVVPRSLLNRRKLPMEIVITLSQHSNRWVRLAVAERLDLPSPLAFEMIRDLGMGFNAANYQWPAEIGFAAAVTGQEWLPSRNLRLVEEMNGYPAFDGLWEQERRSSQLPVMRASGSRAFGPPQNFQEVDGFVAWKSGNGEGWELMGKSKPKDGIDGTCVQGSINLPSAFDGMLRVYSAKDGAFTTLGKVMDTNKVEGEWVSIGKPTDVPARNFHWLPEAARQAQALLDRVGAGEEALGLEDGDGYSHGDPPLELAGHLLISGWPPSLLGVWTERGEFSCTSLEDNILDTPGEVSGKHKLRVADIRFGERIVAANNLVREITSRDLGL